MDDHVRAILNEAREEDELEVDDAWACETDSGAETPNESDEEEDDAAEDGGAEIEAEIDAEQGAQKRDDGADVPVGPVLGPNEADAETQRITYVPASKLRIEVNS